MLRATAVVRKAAVNPARVADTVTLDHAGRAGPPAALKGEQGLEFTLALDKAAALNDGDALRLDDGRLVTIRAAPERLLEMRAQNPARLMRLAWQLGGLHAAVEITADAIYAPNDPSLAELARGQGCTATPTLRPLKPERAAHAHDCGHDHGHTGHEHAGHHPGGHDHGGHDHAGHDHTAHDHAGHRHGHDHGH